MKKQHNGVEVTVTSGVRAKRIHIEDSGLVRFPVRVRFEMGAFEVKVAVDRRKEK